MTIQNINIDTCCTCKNYKICADTATKNINKSMPCMFFNSLRDFFQYRKEHNIENHMEEVAKLLGIKLDEPFKIIMSNRKKPESNIYKLTEFGLMWCYGEDLKYCSISKGLQGLLTGKHIIIKLEK